MLNPNKIQSMRKNPEKKSKTPLKNPSEQGMKNAFKIPEINLHRTHFFHFLVKKVILFIFNLACDWFRL